ncbi:MAG: hypothetical protein C4543_05220 [Ignavibacteriales bacterium]|jgi:hypothetical protein|nr:MAG: hypothetical protein C4543_05220 [Ignavibacteriales bacterium]
MKTIKIYTIIFAVMLFSTTSIYAQKPSAFSTVVTENLIESLNHDVEGVVEASIYNTLFLSKYYPDANIEKVLDELNEIAISSINPVLRYKAQLAVLYITNYSNEELRLEDYKENQSDIFRMISSKLENSLLVSN